MSIDYLSMSEVELEQIYFSDDDDVEQWLTDWELEEPEPWELLLGPNDLR